MRREDEVRDKIREREEERGEERRREREVKERSREESRREEKRREEKRIEEKRREVNGLIPFIRSTCGLPWLVGISTTTNRSLYSFLLRVIEICSQQVSMLGS